MKVAYYSPLPPSRSGIADYSALLIPALEERIEVVVVKPGLDLALTLKAGAEPGIVAELVREHLQRDGALERKLRGTVDRAHPPVP